MQFTLSRTLSQPRVVSRGNICSGRSVDYCSDALLGVHSK